MQRQIWLSLVIVLTLSCSLPVVRVDAQARSGPQAVYFPQGGHHLDNQYGFLDYWRRNGQVVRFGYPLTEVLNEEGRPVQYFERARLEYHAQFAGTAQSIQLGLVGQEATAGRSFPKGTTQRGRLFPTGYTVFAKFLQYWDKRGGLAQFGNPISEEYTEIQPDGSQLIVQHFERARFEYRPETIHPFFRERARANGVPIFGLYEVTLSQVGRQVVQQRGLDTTARARRSGVPDWSPTLWPRRIDIDLTRQRLTAFEGDLRVWSAGVSTGRDTFETPVGNYSVYGKLLYDDMSGNLQGEEYDVRKVPYVQYFHKGYALHGTYWHNQFGTGVRRSHGCVNLAMDDAQWLWEWSAPVFDLAKARRAPSTKPPIEPQSAAEAELQPLEGLAIFARGTQVVVHK